MNQPPPISEEDWGDLFARAGQRAPLKSSPVAQPKSKAEPVVIPPCDPFEHWCAVCGVLANFGFEVKLLKGQVGKWFCGEHRPDRGARNV